MINWDNLTNATVEQWPYKHIVVENFIDADVCAQVYDEIAPRFNDMRQPDMGGWPVLSTEGIHSELCYKLANWGHLGNDWGPIMKKIGALNKESKPISMGYQANAHDMNFGPHNDCLDITGSAAKILIHISKGHPGTKVYDGTTLGDDLGSNETDLAKYEVSETTGNVGTAFIFPCTDMSYHGTDFSSLTQDDKRILLAGQWNG
tara:strand:- start:340 stop:951 length:612 start_codon:yes stop_codon:yes gene_type:complete